MRSRTTRWRFALRGPGCACRFGLYRHHCCCSCYRGFDSGFEMVKIGVGFDWGCGVMATMMGWRVVVDCSARRLAEDEVLTKRRSEERWRRRRGREDYWRRRRSVSKQTTHCRELHSTQHYKREALSFPTSQRPDVQCGDVDRPSGTSSEGCYICRRISRSRTTAPTSSCRHCIHALH